MNHHSLLLQQLAGNSTSGGHPMRAKVGEPRSHVDIVTPHMMMNNTEMRDGGEAFSLSSTRHLY